MSALALILTLALAFTLIGYCWVHGRADNTEAKNYRRAKLRKPLSERLMN